MDQQGKPRSHKPVPLNENGKADVLTPKQVAVPVAPTYAPEDGDRVLHDEQQVARVEILMTKGVRDRRRLMILLEVDDPRKMDRYMQRVYARWEIAGATQDFARHRGEGLARLDMIEAEIWQAMSNSGDDQKSGIDPRVVMVATKNLIDLQSQRLQLLGLTPKRIEQLSMTDAAKAMVFAGGVAAHDKMSRIAQRMLAIVSEAAKAPSTIDHDGGEAQTPA